MSVESQMNVVATTNLRIRKELRSSVVWGLELGSSDERPALPLYARRITCEEILSPPSYSHPWPDLGTVHPH